MLAAPTRIPTQTSLFSWGNRKTAKPGEVLDTEERRSVSKGLFRIPQLKRFFSKLDPEKIPSHIFLLGPRIDHFTLNAINQHTDDLGLAVETKMAASQTSLAYQLDHTIPVSEIFERQNPIRLNLKSMKNPPLILINPTFIEQYGTDIIGFLNKLIKDQNLSLRQAPRIMITQDLGCCNIDLEEIKSNYPHLLDYFSIPDLETKEGSIKLLKNYQESLS